MCLGDQKFLSHTFKTSKQSSTGENKLLPPVYPESGHAQAYTAVAFNSQTRNFFRVNFRFPTIWV